MILGISLAYAFFGILVALVSDNPYEVSKNITVGLLWPYFVVLVLIRGTYLLAKALCEFSKETFSNVVEITKSIFDLK